MSYSSKYLTDDFSIYQRDSGWLWRVPTVTRPGIERVIATTSDRRATKLDSTPSSNDIHILLEVVASYILPPPLPLPPSPSFSLSLSLFIFPPSLSHTYPFSSLLPLSQKRRVGERDGREGGRERQRGRGGRRQPVYQLQGQELRELLPLPLIGELQSLTLHHHQMISTYS